MDTSGEYDAIDRASSGPPATIQSLRADLLNLGLPPGATVLVHSSMKSLGWVSGGPVAIILALEMALGHEGTLVMPTHSSDLSDPAYWRNPPVPAAWWPVIRDTMPAFDPDLTPTRGMGKIPETFRRGRGVVRSTTPTSPSPPRGRWPSASPPLTRLIIPWASARPWPGSTTWTAGCCCWAWAIRTTRRYIWPSIGPIFPASRR